METFEAILNHLKWFGIIYVGIIYGLYMFFSNRVPFRLNGFVTLNKWWRIAIPAICFVVISFWVYDSFFSEKNPEEWRVKAWNYFYEETPGGKHVINDLVEKDTLWYYEKLTPDSTKLDVKSIWGEFLNSYKTAKKRSQGKQGIWSNAAEFEKRQAKSSPVKNKDFKPIIPKVDSTKLPDSADDLFNSLVKSYMKNATKETLAFAKLKKMGPNQIKFLMSNKILAIAKDLIDKQGFPWIWTTLLVIVGIFFEMGRVPTDIRRRVNTTYNAPDL